MMPLVEHPTTVALVLGSGGARGYAHIGAIQVLEERGFDIVAVSGSSMGALVGGLHAAGKLDEYSDWVQGLTQLDVVRLLDVSLSAPGAIRAGKVVARVRELLDGALIEDLPIPYTAVATDLAARREVWFQRGLVEVAIRASIAIPGVITPVMLNGRLLADGGILNPIPIAPTTAVRADTTIAVSLAGDVVGSPFGPPELESAESGPVDEWIDRFRRSAASLLDRDAVRSVVARFGGGAKADDAEADGGAPPDSDPFDPLPGGLSKFEIMSQSLDAMQSVLGRYRMAGYPPDVLVAVPKDACRSLDFHRAAEMIERGRRLTEEALDRVGLAAVSGSPDEPPGGADIAPPPPPSESSPLRQL